MVPGPTGPPYSGALMGLHPKWPPESSVVIRRPILGPRWAKAIMAPLILAPQGTCALVVIRLLRP